MKTKLSTILHYRNNDHRSPATIAHITKIPVRTVKYNIAKIKEQGTIEDRPRNGRPRKITATDNKSLSQWIPRNNETTSNLNGTYQSTWSFNFSSLFVSIGFIQHDYAGHQYFADSNARGIYIYNQNSTFYTVLNRACVWSCSIKVTKRNITLVSLNSSTYLLYCYNF